MAKRKARGGGKKAKATRKPRKAQARRSVRSKAPKRRAARKPARKPARRKKAAPRTSAPEKKGAARASAPLGKTPRLDRPRRTLDDDTIPTPPSSLNMDRRGTAARTGRAELEQDRQVHGSMTRGITGGDVDVNLEQAYFSGDEAPGGDNPTPDQDVVEDIGRAIGIEYQDNEELRASDKVADRDKHRWELDPASAEDYKERK
jgi:Family of unknown function (DUF6335)